VIDPTAVRETVRLSFSQVRRFGVEVFPSLLEARVVINDYRKLYLECRPTARWITARPRNSRRCASDSRQPKPPRWLRPTPKAGLMERETRPLSLSKPLPLPPSLVREAKRSESDRRDGII